MGGSSVVKGYGLLSAVEVSCRPIKMASEGEAGMPSIKGGGDRLAGRLFMLKRYRHGLSERFQRLACIIVRVYSWTLHMTIENEAPWLSHLKGGGRVLICAGLSNSSSPSATSNPMNPITPRS